MMGGKKITSFHHILHLMAESLLKSLYKHFCAMCTFAGVTLVLGCFISVDEINIEGQQRAWTVFRVFEAWFNPTHVQNLTLLHDNICVNAICSS